jgi:D-beta-D-heptose 7-phosphate kinase/D-beta-D-heptose 1-phosphate adenosyltransferase
METVPSTKAILRNMSKKILVIGESCNDKWIYVDCKRIAPDLPIPVVTPNHESENPGMAMNVKRNIESLGQECDIITNENWREVTKTRIVHEASNHTFLRIDSNDKVIRINIDLNKLNDYDLIIISDYNKGFLHQTDIEAICHIHNNVFLDTKKILGNWAINAKFIKINGYEYKNSLPFLTPDLHTKIIHTDGARGTNYQGKNYPVESVEVKDGSGAGDTHISGLAVEFLKTNDIDLAIRFANKCAAKVVKERGVTTV